MRKAGKLFSIIPHFLSWPKKGEMPGSVCFRRQFLQYDQLLPPQVKITEQASGQQSTIQSVSLFIPVPFPQGFFISLPTPKNRFLKDCRYRLRPHALPKGYTVTVPLFTGNQAKNLFQAPEIWNFPSPSSLAEEGSQLLPATFVYLPQACHRPSASCSLEYGFPFISTAQNEGQQGGYLNVHSREGSSEDV